MFDIWEHTVEAGTTSEEPDKVECRISPGFLRSVYLYFPPGCHGYVKSRITLGERQVMPRSAGNYIAANGVLVPATYLNEPTIEELPTLNWYLWSPDADYDHKLWLAAEWISEPEPPEKSASNALLDFIEILQNVMGLGRG